MKLGIGSVQFGLDYGISNKAGKTPADEVREILELAAKAGVQVIDTAPLYGSSEEVLGRALPGHEFRIVTKTLQLRGRHDLRNWASDLEATFRQSLHRLGQSSLYGLLVHDAEDLLGPFGRELMERARGLKDKGLVQKIGVSVYTGRQIDAVLESFPPDLIQLPVNVLDQRLVLSGHLSRLKAQGVEIHARSVFLQGLLLMEPGRLPGHFGPVQARLEDYHKTLNRHRIPALQAALGFVSSLPEIDVVLCGINNRRQLAEIISAIGSPLPDIGFAGFAVADEKILNPSLWVI